MKLCPFCNETIIPDHYPYCFACEHKANPNGSAWDGGFPSGGIGRGILYNSVQLTVKNEITSCEDKTGYAIYDFEGRKIGVLYRKADDGLYKYWDGLNYADCKQIDSIGTPKEQIVKKYRGTYDVEAIFFEQYRNVFGDNRKIMVGRRANIDDFQRVKESFSSYRDSNDFTFYNLQAGHMRTYLSDARQDYRKILLGAFLIDDFGEIIIDDNTSYLESYVLLFNLLNYPATEICKPHIVRSTTVCKKQQDAFMKYNGEICFDLSLNRHIVYFTPTLSPTLDKIKDYVQVNMKLTKPLFVENDRYREVDIETIAKIPTTVNCNNV